VQFGTDAMLSEYGACAGDRGDALVREHLPLVKRIAHQLAVKLPSHIEMDDLIQVGLIGLLKAAEDWQRDSGAVFSTYATIRIRGAMLDELRSRDWLPRSVQRDLGRVAAAIERAEQRLGAAPAKRTSPLSLVCRSRNIGVSRRSSPARALVSWMKTRINRRG
jgi:RNA polymerase sigma factor for flagellar operon FliA